MTDQPVEPNLPERRTNDVAVAELIEATKKLTIAVETTESRRKRDRVVYLTLLVVTLLIGVPASVGAIYAAVTANDVHNTQKISRATGDQIKDCLDPSGLCYKRSQGNLAQAVASVVDSNHNGKLDTSELLEQIKVIEQKLGITATP